MAKRKPDEYVIGAEPISVDGPATIIHIGGDPLFIADVNGGLASDAWDALVYEGEEVTVEGEDEFEPADASQRSREIGPSGAVLRAQGQANVKIEKKVVIEKKEAAVA